jgi:hypothetical protein
VGQALLYAVSTGGALVVGAALGCFRTPPTRLVAGMLAFAAGALIGAVAFEFIEPAHRQAGLASVRPLRCSWRSRLNGDDAVRRPPGPARPTAVGHAQRGSDMAVVPETLHAMPTSKETT